MVGWGNENRIRAVFCFNVLGPFQKTDCREGMVGAMVGFLKKEKTVNKVVLLPVDSIVPNPAQPRTVFGANEIQSLADSIMANGLLQPLTVRKTNDKYELVSGERRLRAIRQAKMEEAPCIVIDTSDRQSAILALLENIQREDLNYFEEAVALKNLMVEWGVSQQELGVRLGKAQPTIANKLRLLKFEPEEQKELLKKGINERQARALLRLEDSDRLRTAVDYISTHNLNVSQTEEYIELISQEKQKPKKRLHPVVKDVRLFFNTINNAISLMNQSGIHASAEKVEKEDYIEYIVKIPIAN